MIVEHPNDIPYVAIGNPGSLESLPMTVAAKRLRKRVEDNDSTLNAKYRQPFGFQAPKEVKGGNSNS